MGGGWRMNNANSNNQRSGNLINAQNLKFLRAEYETYRMQQLLHTLNTVGTALLTEADDKKFEDLLLESMARLALCMDVDRINIWRNEAKDGDLCCTMQYGWFNEIGRKWAHFQPGDAFPYDSKEIEYVRNKNGNISHGQKNSEFLKGKIVNDSLSSMSREKREGMERYGIKSILIIPVFLGNSLCSITTFDDCHKNRAFTDDEIDTMRSASLLIAHAIQRSNKTQDVPAVAAEFETATANYAGVILSVDRSDVITLFNGLRVDRFGMEPASVVDRRIDDVFHESQYLETVLKIRKAFTDGTQNWMAAINGAVLRMCAVPVCDDGGCVTSVVCSIDDVTEMVNFQVELTSTLKSALEKANLANSAKNKFLARMSYEMRAPLNAIIGLSELAFDNDKLNPESLAIIEKVFNAGMSLLDTVNDLLDISKNEADTPRPVPGNTTSQALSAKRLYR